MRANKAVLQVMLDAQIDTDWDNLGDAGMLKKAYRPMAFLEDRGFAKRSHVQGRKGVDVISIGLTRIVDKASAHSLPPGGLLRFRNAKYARLVGSFLRAASTSKYRPSDSIAFSRTALRAPAWSLLIGPSNVISPVASSMITSSG